MVAKPVAASSKSRGSSVAASDTPAKPVRSRAVAKPAGPKIVVPAAAKSARPKAGSDAKPVKTNADKPKKLKLVRDSFTMPEAEFSLLDEVKKRCVAKGTAVKKSEILRAAISAFAAQTDAAIIKALGSLAPIKTGRPPKGSK